MASKKLFACSQSASLQTESTSVQPTFEHIGQQLCALKQQSKCISQSFEEFKEVATNELNKSLGKLSSLIQREFTTNRELREQLSIVKCSNQSMKKEVVQLREMIEQFVESYNAEIETKNAQIRELKARIGISEERVPSEPNHFCGTFLLSEEHESDWKSLEIIQQVSEHTASHVDSIRETSFLNSAKNTDVSAKSNLTESQSKDEADDERSKKKKGFLNFFRKNVDESVVIESKEREKSEHSNSIDELNLADSDQINLPKTIKSPLHIQSLMKKSKRFLTEQDKQNTHCGDSNDEPKTTSHRRNNSHQENQEKSKSQSKSRSSSKGRSKEKIKLASKMVEENCNFNKTNRKAVVCVRPSVHLGGKVHLRKLVKDIRVALQQYRVWEGVRQKEVKYEGERRNGMRWGKGRLLYENGFEYDGNFVQNYRHGIGTVGLNGIVFYEGQFSLDELSGHGYVKSMKNYSDYCPKPLSEASYCGQLLQNKLHGMGTLFINQNEKFVSKFVHGVPIGDFTYYNLTEIQFGSWF